MLNVTVFCGARGGQSIFSSAITTFAQALAQNGDRIIYGGANVGLMGELANSALAHSGSVTGIITQHLADYVHEQREIVHRHVSEIIIVETLSERKTALIEHADVIVVFPGGLGTLDELFEVLTLNQLGITQKTVILVSLFGYFQSIHAFFEIMLVHGFARPHDFGDVHIVSSVEETLTMIDEKRALYVH